MLLDEAQCGVAEVYHVETRGKVAHVDLLVLAGADHLHQFAEAVVDRNRGVGFDAQDADALLGGVRVDHQVGLLVFAHASGEEGHQGHVAVHRDYTRILRVFIAPLREDVTWVREGLDDGRGACHIDTTTAHRTFGGVADQCQRVGRRRALGKLCRVGGVARYCDGTRVVGVAVVPASEHVAFVGKGADFSRTAFDEGATAEDLAHFLVGAQHRDGVGLGCAKLGHKLEVAVHDDRSRVIGVAVVPSQEGGIGSRNGPDFGWCTGRIDAAASHLA